MTVEAFIGGLSNSDKLLAMELIWRDLSATSDDLLAPDWHDAVVHERMDRASPGEVLDLRDSFDEIQGWRNARKTSS